MKRLLPFPFLVLVVPVVFFGSLGGMVYLRSQQAALDQDLVQAWQRFGLGLKCAMESFGEVPPPELEPGELSRGNVDTVLQERLSAIGLHIDSLCRGTALRGFNSNRLDSLRESLRRDREHLGLALSRYRTERQSYYGKWLLKGFPVR